MVGWSSAEATRFRARRGDSPPHLQVLEFLQQRGDFDMSQGIAVTSLKRLIETPGVREKLGIALEKKKLYRVAEEEPVAKALKHIVENLPPVGRIYTLKDRLAYASTLPRSIKVRQTLKDQDKVPLESGATTTRQQGATGRAKTSRPRTRLIPSTCVLNVTDERVRGIEHELRRLDINRFPNAVSVLMRVFIELSLDCYVDRNGLAVKPEDSLSKKLQVVVKELVLRKKLTQAQAKPVNRACSGKIFLVPSVKLMHEYVHNQYLFPAPGDLLAHWNSLQPFITAVWSV